jgi:hypothetical protein
MDTVLEIHNLKCVKFSFTAKQFYKFYTINSPYPAFNLKLALIMPRVPTRGGQLAQWYRYPATQEEPRADVQKWNVTLVQIMNRKP